MLEPYRLIVVNVIACIIVLSGILFYIYIYPKKKINLFVLLVIISLVPLFSMLRAGDYESGDLNLHIYRTISFYKGLSDGQFIPSWGDGLNATYGYPVFIFNYIFPYYIVSFLHFIGFSFISGMKIFLALCYVASGIFMYLFAKNIFKNSMAAFTAAIFYLFAPYHLVDLHFRATAGETAAFAFLPILLFAVQNLFMRQNLASITILGLAWSLSFIAHSAETVLSSFVIIGPYSLFQLLKSGKQKTKTIASLFFSGIIALILSGFAWLPHIIYHKYTLGGTLNITYRPLWELFYTPWRSGFLFQGPKGEIGFLIGYTSIFVVFAFLFLLITKRVRKHRAENIFWLCLFFIAFFLVTEYSKPIWQSASLLNMAQFSTRVLLQVAFVISILAGYLVVGGFKKPFIFLLIIITIGTTMLNWGNRRVIPQINDATLISNLPLSTISYEGIAKFASPKWVDPENPWEKEVPKEHIEVISGKATIKPIKRNTINHEYIYAADTNIVIRENTLYFPGWSVKIDNKNVPIDYENKKYRGVIAFKAPAGLHHIQISYADTPWYAISKKVSILGFLACILYLLISTLNKYNKKLFR